MTVTRCSGNKKYTRNENGYVSFSAHSPVLSNRLIFYNVDPKSNLNCHSLIFGVVQQTVNRAFLIL